MTLSIKGPLPTLSLHDTDTQHNAECSYAGNRYAEVRYTKCHYGD